MATPKKPAAPAPAETEVQTPSTAAPTTGKPAKTAKAAKTAAKAPEAPSAAPVAEAAAPAPVAPMPAVEPETAPESKKTPTKAPKATKATSKASTKAAKNAVEPAEALEAAPEAVEETPEAVEETPEAAEAAEATTAAAIATPPAPFVEPLPELPDAFGADRIVVMARDPESAFIYRELTPDGVGRARASLGASAERAQLVRRLYRGAGDAATAEDHPVRDWLGRHTWHADRAGQRLGASIGFLADGVFVHVTQAAPARLPRRTPGDAPVRFVRVGPKVLTRAEPATPPAASGVRISYAFAAEGSDSGAPGDAQASPGNPAGAPAGSRHLLDADRHSGGMR